MKLPKVVLAFVLALGMSLGMSAVAGAQGESGGALSVTKQCGPGVSGSATFTITYTILTVTNTAVVSIQCRSTMPFPAGTFVVGTVLTFHETTPPAGAVAVADKTITVTAIDQSVTIVNNPPTSGGLSIHKVCPPGFNGTATFSVTFTLANDASGGSSSVNVPCGQTTAVSIPSGSNFTNTTFVAHESTPPVGAKAAVDQSGHLSGDAQTLTFTDTAGPAGALRIHKICASGVSGTASFSITVTPIGATAQTVTMPVECGETVTVAIPSAVALVGAAVTVHETTPPTHGLAAADFNATLSANAQTLTINNALATGALKIQKTCASGVSGTARFVVTVTPTESSAAQVSVDVPCGQTVVVAVPAAKNLIGSAVKIHESTPPTNGVAAADVTAALTAADQTLTIDNAAAPVVVVLPPTGSAGMPQSGLPVVFLILGVLLIGSGIGLLRRRMR